MIIILKYWSDGSGKPEVVFVPDDGPVDRADLRRERDDARRAAAVWKRAAKIHRKYRHSLAKMWVKELGQSVDLGDRINELNAEIQALRVDNATLIDCNLELAAEADEYRVAITQLKELQGTLGHFGWPADQSIMAWLASELSTLAAFRNTLKAGKH